MKKFTKVALIAILAIGLLCTGTISYLAEASEVKNLERAEALKELELLKGTDKGFELENEVTRAEGAVMLVRLLGKEAYVLENEFEHPFKDLPEWVDKYIGYLYQEGLTRGTGKTTYNPRGKMEANQYLTFILRSLGYDDSKGDFKWNESIEKAHTLEIISKEEMTRLKAQEKFIRDDMVGLSYDGLKAKLKDSSTTLIDNLVAEKVVKVEKAIKYGLHKEEDNKEVEGDKPAGDNNTVVQQPPISTPQPGPGLPVEKPVEKPNPTTIKIPTVEARAGEEINIPISIENTGEMVGFQLSILYNKDIITEASLQKGSLMNSNNGWSIMTNNKPGTLNLIGYTLELKKLNEGQGELLILKVKLSDNIPKGTNIALSITNPIISNKEAEKMDVKAEDGVIVIK